MNDKDDDIRSDSLCLGSAGDFITITESTIISSLQLVLDILAGRVFRRILQSREKGLSASSCPSVFPHISIIYHIIYQFNYRCTSIIQRKHCCLSVAKRHKVTIQDTTVCWWANIQGIVTVELTSATD